ncbi:MAG TPA: helix-turn-helix domain-containing protein [Hyphomicrobiaceae bacterium]|nr:helix-turn-helix domain-containing protein [Hyphomicrobiaceae bacterium]
MTDRTRRETGDTGSTILAGYMTEQELADELDVTRRTLMNWRARGEAPPMTRIGLRIYYARDDVRKWLRSQRVEAA